MALHFDHIFTGVGVGRGHVDGQHLVQRVPGGGIGDPAVIELMGAPGRRGIGRMLRAEDLPEERKCLRAAQAHDADSAIGGRRRRGDNGVGGRQGRHWSARPLVEREVVAPTLPLPRPDRGGNTLSPCRSGEP